MSYFGIDLGSSNTFLAELSFQGDVVGLDLLKSAMGDVSVPSVVHFRENGDAVVGNAARPFLANAPECTFELMKVRFGVEDHILYQMEEQPKNISPQLLMGCLLKSIRAIPNAENVSKAVVTVPAECDDSRRRATQQAASIAGIDLVELLSEPSAAILYHLYKTYGSSEKMEDVIGNKEKNYFVFDFGGDTLDLALVHIQSGKDASARPEVIANLATPNLGGSDIDFAFMDTLLEEMENGFCQNNFFRNIQDEFCFYFNNGYFRFEANMEVKRFLSELKAEVERAKVLLTFNEEVAIAFNHPDFAPIAVERAFFEEVILENRFKDKILESLDCFRQQLTGKVEIEEIVMVGGSSQIPYIKHLLEEYFQDFGLGGRIVTGQDYSTAVARGAAIQSALRSGVSFPPFGKNPCNSVLAHDIFIEHMGERELLIKHGTPYPMDEGNAPIRRFEISHALQESIPIQIKEVCDRYDKEKNEFLRFEKVILDIQFHHPFFYHGDTVIVKAFLDSNGILRFSAIHEATGEQIEFEAQEACQLNPSSFDSARREVEVTKFM